MVLIETMALKSAEVTPFCDPHTQVYGYVIEVLFRNQINEENLAIHDRSYDKYGPCHG